MDDIHNPMSYIDPAAETMLLTDVKEADLRLSVAQALDTDFLSIACDPPTWPVSGILFGPNHRPFVNLIVRRKNRAVNVFFLFDTGSPNTHISTSTMAALGISENIPDTITGSIHDVPLSAISLSPLDSHYADLNVLGANFMVAARGKFTADYKSLGVSLAHA